MYMSHKRRLINTVRWLLSTREYRDVDVFRVYLAQQLYVHSIRAKLYWRAAASRCYANWHNRIRHFLPEPKQLMARSVDSPAEHFLGWAVRALEGGSVRWPSCWSIPRSCQQNSRSVPLGLGIPCFISAYQGNVHWQIHWTFELRSKHVFGLVAILHIACDRTNEGLIGI